MRHQDSHLGSQDARIPTVYLIFQKMSPGFLLHAFVGTLAPRPRDRNPSRWQKGPVMRRMSL